MIKSNSSQSLPCSPTTTNCVTWQGGDLPALGIINGQLISVTVNQLAAEVIALKESLDLSDLDLECLLSSCVACPEPEKTLTVVLELLIRKACDLETAVNALKTATGAGTDPLIQLASCLQYTDTSGNLVVQLPHTAYSKRLAAKLCEFKLDLDAMQNEVDTLDEDINDPVSGIKKRLNDLENSAGDEVSSDCLFVGERAVPEAFELLDQAFCQLRTALGLPTDINVAMGQQCDNLNVQFGTDPNWKLSPQNMAHSLTNAWIVICKLLADNEQLKTCCQPTCDDVKIGFGATLNASGDSLIIRFTSGNGTYLPAGFVDDGSVLTVTDALGNVEEFNVEIVNNGTETLLATGLDLNAGDLTMSLEAKTRNGTTLCQKCIHKTVKLDSSCTFCELTASGTSGTVTIIYEDSAGFTYVPFEFTTSSTTTTTTAP